VANLLTLLANRVQVRQALGDGVGFLADHRARVALARQAGDEAAALDSEVWVQAALGDQALQRITTGDLVGAEALLDEQEEICRRVGVPALGGLQACVGNRAILRRQQGRYDEALALLDEQQAICAETGNAQGALMAVANRGDVLAQMPGRTADARAALQEARQTAAQYGMAPMVAQLDQMLTALPPA
jgi:tetratricopeptide (TPR) repeat protein